MMFVLTVPDFKSTTVIPKGSSSSLCELENMAIAAFEALYTAWKGIVITDALDVWLTIIPLDFTNNGKKA